VIETSAARVDSAAFLEALEDKAGSAASAIGGFEDLDLEVAGFAVRLRFAGPTMRRLFTPALLHLVTEPAASPDLVVRVWDSESTGTTMFPPLWDLEDFRQHGVIRGLFDDGVYAVYTRWASSLSVVDARHGQAWFWTKAASDLPSLERAAPLRTVLRLWTARNDVLLAHGAAVGDARGCVLLAGGSGAGKSSAALTFLASELSYLGDDCCLVTAGRAPRVHSLYSSAKVHPDTLRRIPQLAPMVDDPRRRDDGKVVVFLAGHVPERVLRDARLRGIAIPRITGRTETGTSHASAAAALSALAPSTMLQFPGADQDMLRDLGGIVRAVPCHFLDVGTEPESTASTLSSLLEAA
jgi:hypothetical protein